MDTSKHPLLSLIGSCLTAFLCLIWSSSANSFYTVHKVDFVNLEIYFQTGLGSISSSKIRKKDLLEELKGSKPDNKEILAAVIDCNSPSEIHLVVWSRLQQTVVPDTDTISLRILDSVVNRKGNKDINIVLLDAEALFGSGFLTARVTFHEIKDKFIPPDTDPDDSTFCASKMEGLSAAGIVEGDSLGIVTGGRLNFGKPEAAITEFIPPL